MASDESEEALTVPEPVHEPRVTVDNLPAELEGERYKRVGRLGKGGMGDIQLVNDTRIARDVAMKLLRPQYRDRAGYRERFLFEARLQGQLEHPAIVPVHDLGVTAEGELYFTMKRIRGVTLASALKDRAGTYSRRRLLTAFSSVCLAVDFAHARGVVHRDLKPHNIMLGDFGEVYVLDWGIAKLMDHSETPLGELADLPGPASQTRPGATLGTPPYIAPEREQGTPADARSDIYSLGVILGQILEADDDMAPELDAVSVKATAKRPELRFASARELHAAVERFLDGDRDLEARRKASADHVLRAEQALRNARVDPDARSETVREVGRALGLDPANAQALRLLTRLLSEQPETLPKAVQQEIDRRWWMRRARTMRIGAALTATWLLTIPFILWLGVRSWTYFGIFVSLVVAGSLSQLAAARRPSKLLFAIAYVTQTAACAALVTSIGSFGFVPAGFTIALIAWRQTVHQTLHGVLMLCTILALMLLPFGLSAAGVIEPLYRFDNQMFSIVPHMHNLPPMPTLVYFTVVTYGIIAAASVYGRLFVGEIRRAESQLTFQAWQLQQLIPPDQKS